MLRVLGEEGVEYAIIGGNAAVIHGAMRATFDLDIVPALTEENGARLSRALVRLNAKIDGVDADDLGLDPTDPRQITNGANWTLMTAFGRLDVMSAADGVPPWNQLRSTALSLDMGFGNPMLVVSREHLISMKRVAGRRKDIEDIAAVTAGASASANELLGLLLIADLQDGVDEATFQEAASVVVGDADLDARAWIETCVGDRTTGRIEVEPIWATRDFAVALKDSFSARLVGGEIIAGDFKLQVKAEQRPKKTH